MGNTVRVQVPLVAPKKELSNLESSIFMYKITDCSQMHWNECGIIKDNRLCERDGEEKNETNAEIHGEQDVHYGDADFTSDRLAFDMVFTADTVRALDQYRIHRAERGDCHVHHQ